MSHRESIPLQITFKGKVYKGHASPMYENGSIGDYARTYQISFGKYPGDENRYFYGHMMYRESTGWDWMPHKADSFPGCGDQIAAIIEAWYY